MLTPQRRRSLPQSSTRLIERAIRSVWRRVAQVGLVTMTVMVALFALVTLGYISRVKVRALSPDGRIEAVCRGWLPESTEYGVWLRRTWQPWGSHLAHTGTESMGRCRDIIWSPDGRLVVVVNEGNALVVLDVEARRHVGFYSRVAPGDGWDYASERIITSARFVFNDLLEIEHCHRARVISIHGRDFSGCRAERRTHFARLARTPSGISLNVVGERR